MILSIFSDYQIFQYTDACVQPLLEKGDILENEHIKSRNVFSTQKDGTIVPTPAPKLTNSPSLVNNFYFH